MTIYRYVDQYVKSRHEKNHPVLLEWWSKLFPCLLSSSTSREVVLLFRAPTVLRGESKRERERDQRDSFPLNLSLGERKERPSEGSNCEKVSLRGRDFHSLNYEKKETNIVHRMRNVNFWQLCCLYYVIGVNCCLYYVIGVNCCLYYVIGVNFWHCLEEICLFFFSVLQ